MLDRAARGFLLDIPPPPKPGVEGVSRVYRGCVEGCVEGMSRVCGGQGVAVNNKARGTSRIIINKLVSNSCATLRIESASPAMDDRSEHVLANFDAHLAARPTVAILAVSCTIKTSRRSALARRDPASTNTYTAHDLLRGTGGPPVAWKQS